MLDSITQGDQMDLLMQCIAMGKRKSQYVLARCQSQHMHSSASNFWSTGCDIKVLFYDKWHVINVWRRKKFYFGFYSFKACLRILCTFCGILCKEIVCCLLLQLLKFLRWPKHKPQYLWHSKNMGGMKYERGGGECISTSDCRVCLWCNCPMPSLLINLLSPLRAALVLADVFLQMNEQDLIERVLKARSA